MINIRRLSISSGWTEAQCNAIDKRYLRHHAHLLVESIRLTAMTPVQLRRQVRLVGGDLLDQALEKGGGALLVGGHTGNWLFALALLSTVGYPVSAAVYEIPIASIERQMKRIWQKYNIGITHLGRGAFSAALRVFERNEVFLVLFDIALRPPRSNWLPMGHASINVDLGPAKLARRSRAPILHMTMRRLDDSSFVLSISHESAIPDEAGWEHAAAAVMTRWLASLHDDVLACPEQWWPLGLTHLRASRAQPAAEARAKRVSSDVRPDTAV